MKEENENENQDDSENQMEGNFSLYLKKLRNLI